MKKLLLFVCIILSLSLVACTGTADVEPSVDGTSVDGVEQSSEAEQSDDVTYHESFDGDGNYIPLNYEFPKIMKLTQWDMAEGLFLGADGNPHGEKRFAYNAKQIMQNIKNDGYNTVLLQMRPFADSFYKSAYYPLSSFVTGSYSKQSVDYDAVEILVAAAHAEGLSIHGWINPMRCMTNKELAALTGDWAITEWYGKMGDGTEQGEYMFAGTDAGGTSRLYLNPAYEEVRSLIINGVDEILATYHVDGIFMDDYFYPEEVASRTEIDALAYAALGDNYASVQEFRRDNVNKLIRGIYSKVKEHGEDYIYGISPNGHISYAYSTECADIYTWCSNPGYCDVMYPQLYYGMLHGENSVSALMEQWDKVLTQPDIKLVPVLTLHKAGNNDAWAIYEDAKTEWVDYDDVLLSSLTYLLINEYRPIDGIGFFCYQYFHGASADNAAVKAERDNYAPIWQNYEAMVGKSKAELKVLYADVGLDLTALGDKWDDRLAATGRLYPLYEFD